MPTYDYECRACGHLFETMHAMSAPALRKCPKCGKLKLARLISGGAGVIFKGGGFYETDYKRKRAGQSSGEGDGQSSKESSGESSKSDKPAETKSGGGGDSKSGGSGDSKSDGGGAKTETKPKKDAAKRD